MLGKKRWSVVVGVACFVSLGVGCATGSPAAKDTQAADGQAVAQQEAADQEEEVSDSSEATSESEQPGEPEDPVQQELDRLEAKAEKKLFAEKSPCRKIDGLRECRELEAEEGSIPAGMCYRDYIDVARMERCRPWQIIKAAANFEAAGERNKAVETRMEAMRMGGSYAPVLTVDAADWFAQHGRNRRARMFYGLYLASQPDGPLVDHVKRRCSQLGGSCGLGEAGDKEVQGKPASK